ncbi:AtpZ/AtpI family protein [Lactobacillus sp. ESL0679]|uniref:AtpZ/AtpI family protein n=1 Tax=Lactobacillus sp. ESL0679 TaxID=2983209 RepID=UPI0023F72540|nr:AtpZ/AtpI family protein [Lactobacillus sp. ESL0679]MDF7683750.1 AtpZ/AtpI family protein [Lactobacillus sp. ESL0679]
MQNYDRKHMMIPKTTKVAIKLWFFNVIDIGIVFLCTFIGLRLSGLYSTLPLIKITMGILGFAMGLFFIIRTKSAPGMRNWRVLIFLLLQDRSKYFPISIVSQEVVDEKSKGNKVDQELFSIKNKNKKLEDQIKNTLALGGPINCTEDGILTYQNGTAARYLQLDSTDLFNLPDSGLVIWQDSLTNVSRTYVEDCAYFVITSRINMSSNQRYWRHLRQKCGTSVQDRQRVRDISEKIEQASMIERRTDLYSSRKYYVQLFADSVKEVRQKTGYYKMGAGILAPKELNRDETIAVEFAKNNPINN